LDEAQGSAFPPRDCDGFVDEPYRLTARRMRGYDDAQARQIFRDLVDMPADVAVTPAEVKVRFHRRAYLPIVLASEHPEGTRRIAKATRRLSRGEPLHEVSPQGFVLALAWGRRLRKELPRVC
jgi:hypothetical protein